MVEMTDYVFQKTEIIGLYYFPPISSAVRSMPTLGKPSINIILN